MPDIFKDYAKIYDIIYKDKDYRGECDFLEKIFKIYALAMVRDLLDIACGTGNHVTLLAKRGFNVYAQDLSSDMLSLAKEKAKSQKLKIKFMEAKPMQNFRHKRKFDAVIAMFSSIDYLTSRKDLKNTFNNIRACLKENGIFTFDFWNKECVLKHYSPLKKKVFLHGEKKVIRKSCTSLDRRNSIASISYTCHHYDNNRIICSIKESHKMKFHYIKEMKKILESCGFKILGCFPFMKIKQRATSLDWNISIVATPKKL
jgi:SAM-dependent methyltransferase